MEINNTHDYYMELSRLEEEEDNTWERIKKIHHLKSCIVFSDDQNKRVNSYEIKRMLRTHCELKEMLENSRRFKELLPSAKSQFIPKYKYKVKEFSLLKSFFTFEEQISYFDIFLDFMKVAFFIEKLPEDSTRIFNRLEYKFIYLLDNSYYQEYFVITDFNLYTYDKLIHDIMTHIDLLLRGVYPESLSTLQKYKDAGYLE